MNNKFLRFHNSAFLFSDGLKNNTALSGSDLKPCAHTEREGGAWWMVDLGGTYNITHVEITNREELSELKGTMAIS